MDLDIQRKVMIVTGGSRGIGEGIVRAVAEEGAIPVIVGLSPADGKALVAALNGKGQEALYIETDLSVPENCKTAVSQTLSRYGRLDALFNNAGVNDGVGLENGAPELFMQSVRNNLAHYYNMAHYSLEFLKKTRGCIINISSKTAVTGQGNTSGYAASKGGQLALTREWAAELLKYGIRVNAIIPAEVDTPQYKEWLARFENPVEKLGHITRHIPLERRLTTVSEIASTAVFLASAKASHMTGQHIFVDGGYVHLDRALDAV